MGEIQEQRFVCKICSKSCVSGKSLGGHMRVHLALIAASKRAAKEKSEIKLHDDDQSNSEEKISGCDLGDGDQSNSYELRENPKKSWRISDPKRTSVSKNWNCCKECGKQFPSLRALSGHMRCHSIKNKEAHQCKKCGKGFDSVKAMFGHMKSHSKKLRISTDSTESLSDLENLCPVRRKRSRIRYKSAPHSAVSEAEEAATCLIMLSRGVTDCLRFEAEFSDDDYVYFGGESSCRSGKFSDYDGDLMSGVEKKMKMSLSTDFTEAFTEKNVCGFDEEQMKVDDVEASDQDELLSVEDEIHVDFVSDDGGFSSSLHISESSTKSAEFEDFLIASGNNEDTSQCFQINCGKEVISSVQESGLENEASLDFDKMQGKNSNHVYMNASLLCVGEVDSKLEHECIDNNVEQASTSEGAVSLESSKSKEYECLICFKVFSSGQALGGHKRAHYNGVAESKNQEVAQVEDMLDLNFPVSMDDKNDDMGINSWWINRSHEHEALMLTN